MSNRNYPGTMVILGIVLGDSRNPAGVSAPVTVTVTPGPVKLELRCRNKNLLEGQTLHCEARATLEHISNSRLAFEQGTVTIRFRVFSNPQVAFIGPLSYGRDFKAHKISAARRVLNRIVHAPIARYPPPLNHVVRALDAVSLGMVRRHLEKRGQLCA